MVEARSYRPRRRPAAARDELLAETGSGPRHGQFTSAPDKNRTCARGTGRSQEEIWSDYIDFMVTAEEEREALA